MMLINSKESLLWYTEVCVQLYQVKKKFSLCEHRCFGGGGWGYR